MTIFPQRFNIIAIACVVLACAPQRPPEPPAPHEGTVVPASFGRTWNGVIDRLGVWNLTIRNIDRQSGVITTDPIVVLPEDAEGLADCGTDRIGARAFAKAATWTVVVRGDSAQSRVRASIKFSSRDAPEGTCSSKAVWETDFETQVREAIKP